MTLFKNYLENEIEALEAAPPGGVLPDFWLAGVGYGDLAVFTNGHATVGVSALRHLSALESVIPTLALNADATPVTLAYTELRVTSIDGLNSLTVETDAPLVLPAADLGTVYSSYGARGSGLAMTESGGHLQGISVADAGMYVIEFLIQAT